RRRSPSRPASSSSRALPRSPCPVSEHLTLARVRGERRGALELGTRLLQPTELLQEVAARGGEERVLAERRLVAEVIDDREPGRGAERHRDRHAAIELDDRRSGEDDELAVAR